MTDTIAVAIPTALAAAVIIATYVIPRLTEACDQHRLDLGARRRRRAIRRHQAHVIDLHARIAFAQLHDDDAAELVIALKAEQDRLDYAAASDKIDWLPRGPVMPAPPSRVRYVHRRSRARTASGARARQLHEVTR